MTTHAPDQPLRNARHEAYCVAYVRHGDQTQAAIDAGYSPKSAKSRGSHLLALPQVQRRVAELQRPAAEAASLTLKEHLDELKTLRDLAKRNGDFSPAVKAEVSRGQAVGLYTKRIRLQIDDPKALLEHLKSLPAQERKAFVLKLLSGDAT